MFTKLLAAAAKKKFISALESNIPGKGSFKTVKCAMSIPARYEICFELFSADSEGKMAITVTAKKAECISTENILTGTNSEIIDWLKRDGAKKLAEKADKVLYECSHFYYP